MAMSLGGLLVFLNIGDVAVIWHFIMNLWYDCGKLMALMAHQLWIYSAPALWLLLWGWTLWWCPSIDPAPDECSWHDHHVDQRILCHNTHCCKKYASIWDYGYHQKYPHHLHKCCVYPLNKPTIWNRMHANAYKTFHSASLCVLERVHHNGHNLPRPRQEGERANHGMNDDFKTQMQQGHQCHHQ